MTPIHTRSASNRSIVITNHPSAELLCDNYDSKDRWLGISAVPREFQIQNDAESAILEQLQSSGWMSARE